MLQSPPPTPWPGCAQDGDESSPVIKRLNDCMAAILVVGFDLCIAALLSRSLALAQNAFCHLKAVGADRNSAIDGDLDEHRAQFIRRKAVDGCAADMIGELAHLAERGDHAER